MSHVSVEVNLMIENVTQDKNETMINVNKKQKINKMLQI